MAMEKRRPTDSAPQRPRRQETPPASARKKTRPQNSAAPYRTAPENPRSAASRKNAAASAATQRDPRAQKSRKQQAKQQQIQKQKSRAKKPQQKKVPDPRTKARMAFYRAQKAQEKAFYRAQRKRVWRARCKLFGVMFALLLVLSILGFSLMLNHASTTLVYSINYQVGTEEEKTVRVSADKTFRDGVMYVNFTPIATLCDMTVTGDDAQRRYTAGDNSNETALFRFGDAYATVNGLEWLMDGDAVLEDGEVYLPYSFVSKYILGLQFTHKGHAVTVMRKYTDTRVTPETAEENEPMESVRFLLSGTTPVKPIAMDETDSSVLGFTADLSDYEKAMNPPNRDDYLILVNRNHLITAEQEPSKDSLVAIQDVRRDGRANQFMNPIAEKALEAMLIDMRAVGLTDVTVTQGYQSYAVINYLYNQAKAAGEAALAEAEFPGACENETGLSCDMHNMTSADVAFGATDAGKWLADNSWKYGFILRYPENKVELTGVAYSPWHFRFVGRFHSIRMYKAGQCLEEYVEALTKSGYLKS